MSTHLPKARTEGVLSQETFEDLVLVDQRHDTAHSLNQTAALVYQHADGTRSVDDLVDVLRSRVGDSADADLVEMTIQELSRADLLERPAVRPAEGSRRRFLQKVALMGTLAAVLPVVESIATPTRDDSRSPVRKEDKKDDTKKKDDGNRRRRRRRGKR